MSADELRDLLHELGSEQPPVRVDPATYRRARRAHLRGVIARTAAVVAVVAATAVAVPRIGQDAPPPPAATDTSPALPTRLYDVPERLAHVGSEGYRWDPALAAGDLAIGTTAAVFPVNSGAVVAVSALDGRYRGLSLAGFDEDAFLRFDGLPVALSPDGARLAYTWNPAVIGSGVLDGYQPSGVRIVDLATGKVTSIRIQGGFGVFAHGFSWSPDGRYLAYTLDVTTDGTGRSGAGKFAMERLDTLTGERLGIRGLARSDHGPAVSDRGEVAVVGNGPPASWLPGRTPVVQKFEGGVGEWTAAWSADGDRLAAGSLQRGWFSVGRPLGLGLHSGTAGDAPSGSMVRALGWIGNAEVALLHSTRDDRQVVTAVPAAHPRGGPGRRLIEVDPMIGQHHLSLATSLLDRPTRATPEPDWPTDWPRVLTLAGIGLTAVLAAAFGMRARGGRRHRTG